MRSTRPHDSHEARHCAVQALSVFRVCSATTPPRLKAVDPVVAACAAGSHVVSRGDRTTPRGGGCRERPGVRTPSVDLWHLWQSCRSSEFVKVVGGPMATQTPEFLDLPRQKFPTPPTYRGFRAQRFYLNLLPVLGFLHHSMDFNKPVTSVFSNFATQKKL